jgi:hypothetical protein
MTDALRRKRVLIVGAGFRAGNNFLPSFALRPDAFEVVGLIGRSTVRSKPLGERWNVPVYETIAAVDPASVDIVAVTVPTTQNRAVLEAILRWNPEVLLAIDTPIAWKLGEYRDILPLIRRFRAVVVAEDFMNFPQFELARRAAAEGLLGNVRSVMLFNTGYAYHGLALLRSFANLAPVTGTQRLRLGSYSSVVGFRFAGGMRGYIVGPYRQAVTGGIVVEGERGVITQAAEDAEFASIGKRMLYRLAPFPGDGPIAGFALENSNYALATPEIPEMAKMPFEDQTPLNVCKNVGLTRIFHALVEPDELNRRYGYTNALYDSFASRLALRGLFPLDPLARFGSDFMLLPRLTIPKAAQAAPAG